MHILNSRKLIGPFCQLLTIQNTPLKGPVSDSELTIIENAGILVENGVVIETGPFEILRSYSGVNDYEVEEISGKVVGLPGLIDAHTHTCFAGSRAIDYALRNSGMSYLQIARQGGGIWNSVAATREANHESLLSLTLDRLNRLHAQGVTTIEIKSGYGLNIDDEMKMLEVIKTADRDHRVDVVSTCLAAHMLPKDFGGSERTYLDFIISELWPLLKEKNLTNRIDIFIEKTAFNPSLSKSYLTEGKRKGFDITVHADQFSVGGSQVAVEVGAMSADHLEASSSKELKILANSNTAGIALPGASLGLGMGFTPAREFLDLGGSLVIASDFNPGSAPMGNLLLQASVLGTYQKLTNAEVFSGITYRAARALNLSDRGKLEPGMLADIVAFPCDDFREITYHQGMMPPVNVWKKGISMQ